MSQLRSYLYRFYEKAEAILVPGLTSSQYTYYETLRRLVRGKIWLDLGCGHQVFTSWMVKEQAEVLGLCQTVFGIDLDWAGLRTHGGISNKVFGNLAELPFADGSMELVTANMVAEHLDDPAAVLREIHRVLTPGGTFLFHTPNARGWVTQIASCIPEALKKRLIWFLERRRAEDVFLTHYRLNTTEQIDAAAAETGFGVEEIQMLSTSAATVMLGPVVLAELLYIRALQAPKRSRRRSNIVAVLRKKVGQSFAAASRG
ncbi:MAG TPA: class I SAM-dependent methyltransferase [Bryobacteraceae bacterium]|jgi:SAM-dependent methyltransferase